MSEDESLDRAAAVKIERDLPTSPDAQYCLGEYYAELEKRFDAGFTPEYEDAPSLDEFMPPRGTFLVIRLGGTPLGCGALKPLPGERAYIKRMWISPSARGLGLGRMLLRALEDEARALGYRSVCLETNKALEEAQQLYRTAGYEEVRPFNDEPYAHHWYEKLIAQS